MRVTLATRVEAAGPGCGEDRIAVDESRDRKVIVIADGAGGVSGGADAAETICRALTHNVKDWTAWLAQRDAALAVRSTGLAAAVALAISADGTVEGASVGDCEAWIFNGDHAVNLTAKQVRKPMLGDGRAVPVGFMARLSGGTLVAATDGLWKYMSHERIAETSRLRPLESAAAAMLEGARLRSGALQDDIAIMMCKVDAT